MDLVTRVASRYRRRTAGFIPDKFWRAKKSELKAILTRPLKDKTPQGFLFALNDLLLPFYDKFADELKKFGIHDRAVESLGMRLDNVKHVLRKVSGGASAFHSALDKAYPYPDNSFEDMIAQAIVIEINTFYEESVETLADGMKAIWKTDERLVKGLADRLAKKATPEEKQAIIDSRKDYSSPVLEKKYGFFRRINLKAAARRLVSREKVTYDPYKWIDFLRDVFKALFTDKAIAEDDAYRQFDMYGMKVIVDDQTVTPEQTKLYIKYLDEAYQNLRRKGLAKVWYGNVFIRCEDCGGTNENTGGGVGGNYPIGPDTVNVFSRPSHFIVDLMAHELGHRYWFKFMNESQRRRFESLIKMTRAPTPLPKRMIEQDKSDEAKKAIDEAVAEVKKPLAGFKTAMLRAKKVLQAIRKAGDILGPAGGPFENAITNAFQKTTAVPENAEAKALFKDALDAAGAVRRKLWDAGDELNKAISSLPDPTGPIDDLDRYWAGALRQILPPWLEELDRTIEAARTAAYVYVDTLVAAHNKAQETLNEDRMREWEIRDKADKRPTPVSDYGKSNIDEAFAEAFMHYVSEKEMNQDQIESFRWAIKSAAVRVVERFLGAV